MLTNELRRARHAAVIHVGPRRLRCVGRKPTTPVGRRPCHIGPSACTFLNEEFAKGESAAVARLALFGTIYCRGVPRHSHIMSRCRRALIRFIRDPLGFSKDPLPLEALVILASDLLQQHRLLDRLAGLELVVSYDLFTRPSETLKVPSRGVIAPQARGYQSVSVIIAQSVAASDATAAHTAKSGQSDDTAMAGLLGSSSNSCGCSSSVSRLSDRPAVAFATEAQRVRTCSQISSHANTTDSVENITSLSSPHGGASTAAIKLLLGHSKERPVGGLQQTSCHYLKKLANSLGKWPYSIPPLSTMQADLCHIRAS